MVATKRVLVVDDEDIVCQSYERVLTNAGYEVEKAHDGEQALANVQARQYDVMLADLRMPGMNGLQVVRQLRATHPMMPVIVITGYPSQDTLQEAALLGVTDYLTKPVPPDVLAQATAAAMTMPMWSGVAPYLTTVGPRPAPPRTWVPDELPKEPPPQTVIPVAEATAVPAGKPPGVIATTVRLCGGLVVSIAYVMFLPLAGFVVLLGLGGKVLLKKLVTRGA